MPIVPDKVVRSRRKTLSVGVDCLGQVTVRAPLKYPDEKIREFLAQKESWILKHKQRMAGAGIRLPGETLDGYELLLLGEKHLITLYDGKSVRFAAEEKRIWLPRNNAENKLRAWIKQNADRIFKEATKRRAEEMGVAYQSVTVSSARTKWGSCTGDNRLSFSFRLLYAPKDVIDYVIVHELSHTLHHDHSKSFWGCVESVVPDYKVKRKWLKDRAALQRIL
ncbi:MAG: M48 family metallopeptidase [Clostridia bacterium]|nr:M48 family metallopeptidase [Clostridia bacterium]